MIAYELLDIEKACRRLKGRESDVAQSCRAYKGTVEYLSVKIIGVIAMFSPLRFLVWVLGGSVSSFENIPLVDVVNSLYSVECLHLYC